MPQELTTAPANPVPTWPADYIAALREAGVQEKTIPFCIHWVRGSFAEYLGRRRRDLGRMEIEAFLHKMAARTDAPSIQPGTSPAAPLRGEPRRIPPSLDSGPRHDSPPRMHETACYGAARVGSQATSCRR